MTILWAIHGYYMLTAKQSTQCQIFKKGFSSFCKNKGLRSVKEAGPEFIVLLIEGERITSPPHRRTLPRPRRFDNDGENRPQ